MQDAVAVGQPLAAAQDVAGGVVRRQHAAAAVQVQDADAAVVQQAGQTGAQRIGTGQRLADMNGLADVRQQRLDQLESSGLPVAAAEGVADGPDDLQVVFPVEPRDQAVLGDTATPALVVRGRLPQLPCGVQVGYMYQAVGGPLREAGRSFVAREVDVEVLARQVRPRLAAVEIPAEVDPRVVAGPFTDHQRVARGAAGLVDQGSCGGPAGVVERGFVQQRKDAVEDVERVHDTLS
ncbi:MAG: hypothetical protein OXH75_03595 [Acidobacteria bacterium]|nr:hypothetical protein [Acidobacteriota bacterium]